MREMNELPNMVTELVDMSKAYLQQETVEPVKLVGRSLGFALASALCFAIGMLLVGVGVLRYASQLLPEGPYWSVLAYVIAIVPLVATIGITMKRAQS